MLHAWLDTKWFMAKIDRDRGQVWEFYWKQVILKEILFIALLKYLSLPHKSQVMGASRLALLSWNCRDKKVGQD